MNSVQICCFTKAVPWFQSDWLFFLFFFYHRKKIVSWSAFKNILIFIYTPIRLYKPWPSCILCIIQMFQMNISNQHLDGFNSTLQSGCRSLGSDSLFTMTKLVGTTTPYEETRPLWVFFLSPVHTSCECECEANLTWIWRHNPPFAAIIRKGVEQSSTAANCSFEFVTSRFALHSHSQEVWTGLKSQVISKLVAMAMTVPTPSLCEKCAGFFYVQYTTHWTYTALRPIRRTQQ